MSEINIVLGILFVFVIDLKSLDENKETSIAI